MLKILIAIAIVLIAFIVLMIRLIKRDEKNLHYMYHPRKQRMNAVADDKLEQDFWGNLVKPKIFS